ncbi:response regulator [Tunturiibacter empetritectus]|uniref:Response regulator n=1 Tax=Tunturiibacter empetritectus TaxID=3069691 RepID=A0AAU7ZIX6_9BACT
MSNADETCCLVVDDEFVIAQTPSNHLESIRLRGKHIRSPEMAIAARAARLPALLITDVMMPGMTGVELAIYFRQAHPECKSLLLSGQAATVDLLEDAGAQGYDFDLLPKPVHPADLLAKLRY